ncbi:hypothetical protein SeLEV6574_g06564 [Synchytrium endobioticum]|nr:hypothetical protein SeLEV6574_g06564 [Synchytrium endobioticum]
MGNGQKAQTRRDRAARDASKAGSQLKINEAAKSIQCKICLQTFMKTANRQQLEAHQSSKHEGKTFEACFPGFAG